MKSIFLLLLATSSLFANAQQHLIYARSINQDKPNTKFQIVGEVGGNILIYKETSYERFISVYDKQMVEIDHQSLSFLPKEIFDVMFINYSDFCYLIYQHQDKHVFYCSAVKLDPMGKKLGDIIDLNSVEIHYVANSGIFQNIISEDKHYLMSIFGNSHRGHLDYQCSYNLFDDQLQLKKTSQFAIRLSGNDAVFTPFLLDNLGNLVFASTWKDSVARNSSKIVLLVKKLQVDTIASYLLVANTGKLDQVKVKIDNLNNRYILSSLYYKKNSDKIEGLFTTSWDLNTGIWGGNSITPFSIGSSGLKNDKTHFEELDDCFIKDILTEKEGHYIVVVESEILPYMYYRWSLPVDANDILVNNPIFFDYPKSRYNSHSRLFFTGEMSLFDFNPDNQLVWNSRISKKQTDLTGNAQLSYKLVKTPTNIHILYNSMTSVKPLLTEDTVSAGGKVGNYPTAWNIDLQYGIMVRLGRQINEQQMLFPCTKKQILSFALMNLNN